MPSITHEIKAGGPFPPEKGRYYLYIGWFCPFATRTTIARSLKGLQDVLPIVVVNSVMDPKRKSWTFSPKPLEDRPEVGIPGTVPEPLHGAPDLRALYEKSEGSIDGPYVVPMLWDSKTSKVVNNESISIMRQLSTAFNEFLGPEKASLNLHPSELFKLIDENYESSQRDVYSGVYKAGFATDQKAYEAALSPLFDGLERLEELKKRHQGPYLLGQSLTELDITTYTCLIRFDVAYATLFKCGLKTIRDGFPELHQWLRTLYWTHDAFRDSTDFDNIKSNYFSGSSKAEQINPTRVVPKGPVPSILPLHL
ncbi:glutathione S-transferase [Acaromyces ingoldii]|uniref:Glutathione S-transferase n=1 Tax=Acaromyces ingoldii TaxID=215250 RepID=A0A316YQP7_9BASI|nr:glutathione S-transferase [Acaromyces ingoldii]PWN91707.1 glutathione S-transferase [Acaromyces ingoldii]